MSTLDIVTLLVFGMLVLLGLAGLVIANAARQRPKRQLRDRLQMATRGRARSASRTRELSDLQRAQSDARRRRRRETMGSLGYYLNRLDTVAGAGGVRHMILAVGALAGMNLLLLVAGVIPMQNVTTPLLVLGGPLLLGVAVYRWQVGRFEQRFLTMLPDAMDMIVRGSKAGIPMTQSINNVGARFEAPLGTEFRRMGDSLVLGNDLQNVLDDAVLRVELPDFTFFAVCLSLQRESGGSVVEALQNLAGIIRARRDLALKARAMTAEGRISGRVLSSLPFIVLGMLYLVNRPYVEILFVTENGRLVLAIAAGMLVVGVLAIRQITRMEL